MVIAFTGHRPNRIPSDIVCKSAILRSLKEYNVNFMTDVFHVGGCPGFDTYVLEVLIENNVPYSHICLFVPFPNFEKYATRNNDENIRANNLNLKVISEGCQFNVSGGNSGTFGQKCYRRNIALCENADVLFTNLSSNKGGTANTVNLAKNHFKIPVINIHC